MNDVTSVLIFLNELLSKVNVLFRQLDITSSSSKDVPVTSTANAEFVTSVIYKYFKNVFDDTLTELSDEHPDTLIETMLLLTVKLASDWFPEQSILDRAVSNDALIDGISVFAQFRVVISE